MRVRQPAVAGTFYPESSAALRRTVDGLVAAVADPGPPPKAMIVPHAGYRYSGTMAALGYATLPPAANLIRHVVLLGPCHRVGLPALALPDADALATPLGDVPVWADGVAAVAGLPHVTTSRAAHAYEHSLEVHLPFLQHTLPDADVVPLAVGWVGAEDVADVLDAVWGGPETLIVVSSDLSHYLAYPQACRRDAATIAQIVDLSGPLDADQACGVWPVNGLLVAARRRHLVPQLVGACNSGDTCGDMARVVGYACIRFDEPAPLRGAGA
ncbi:MAG: AmmeMemoRadiSam system protein B [Bifidobacteriaceae bacterium]|jgi:AmmeMemoRadiSam system protein B|nr:AmmeMemoRadiSam system protein B [Bifidobacteriaceae bacterium]